MAGDCAVNCSSETSNHPMSAGGGAGRTSDRAFRSRDLQASRAELQERGVSFTGELEDTDWGQSIEFTAPEGVRWSLAHAPAYPAGQSVQTPHLG